MSVPGVLICLHCEAMLHMTGRQDHLQPRSDAYTPTMDAVEMISLCKEL